MKDRRASLPVCVTAVLVGALTLALSGCNPALYQRPAEDFRAATASLRETYFLEWEISNQATIKRGDLDDQVQIWSMPAGLPADTLEKFSQRMAERRQQDIHESLRPLREQAFNALEGYATTLMSLSSAEPTERIQSELGGLVKDINATLEAMQGLADLSKVQKFAGPLQQYVQVLNEIVGLVSSVLRERAIIETIGKSNEAIVDLLGVLEEEAEAARENALRQIDEAHETIGRFASRQEFSGASNETKAEVVRRKAELAALRQQLEVLDVKADFDAAVKAQGALVQKAMLKDPGNWTARIRGFRDQVLATKAAVEKIRSEM